MSSPKKLRSVLKEKQTSYHPHPWERTIKDEYSHSIRYVHNSIANPIFPKLKEKPKPQIKFTVIGNRLCKEFIYCVRLVQGMHKYRSKIFDVPEIKGVTQVEWDHVWSDLKIKYSGKSFCLVTEVAVLCNEKFFGGDQELKDFIEASYAYDLCLDYRKEAIKEFASFVKCSGRPFAYMHISIDDKPIGSLIFMLYADIVPNTCDNFLRLCKTTRAGYSGAPIHRIVKDGWIQCGGYSLKGSDLACENFVVPHDRRGVLAMCNDGRHNNCSTQFFVLLQPADWMASKYVAFGQLVDGKRTLERIERVPTWYESPLQSVLIEKSGILNMECKHMPIHKYTNSYLNKHVEDLITVGELLTEAIMARVWSTIEARRLERKKLRSQQSDSGSEVNVDRSHRSVTSQKKSASSMDSSNKENQAFDVSSYMEESAYLQSSLASTARSGRIQTPKQKPKKLYYLPFTDIPYPGETHYEDFDLKRFLQGFYCLECDLRLEIPADEHKKDNLRFNYSSIPSAMFLIDDDKIDEEEDTRDLDTDEEEEIKNYIKNNVDRVSFAGEIIKNIGKGNAMFNLFEGARKSEMISMNEDDLKKLRRLSMYDRRQSIRKSEMITLNDEELRKLRRASAMERPAVRKSLLPSLDDENIQKLRRISMMDRKTETIPERRQSLFDRRQSLIDPTGSRKSIPHSLGLDEEQLNRLRRISMFDQSMKDGNEDRKSLLDKKVSISVPREERTQSKIMRRPTGFIHPTDLPPLKLPVIIERKDDSDEEKQSAIAEEMKKRRQTAFAEDLTRVKSFQKDLPNQNSEEDEEEESSDDETGKIKIKLPPGASKAPKKIRRRPTGFMRPEDLMKYGIDVDEDDIKVQIKLPDGAKDTPTKIKRRQTGYVRKSELKNLVHDDDEPSVTIDAPLEVQHKEIKRRQTGYVPAGSWKKMMEEQEEGEEEEEEEEEKKEIKREEFDTYDDIDKRRVTGFANDDELTKVKYVQRKSASSSSSSSISSSDLHVHMDPSTVITRETSHLRRPTGYIRADQVPDEEDTNLRKSVLTRLLEDTHLVDDQSPPPTLKNYVPISERIPRNLLLTWNSTIKDQAPETQLDKEKNYIRPSAQLDDDTFNEVADLQYSKRISSKVSYDYVRRLNQFENAPELSLRTIEYAKSRPTLTVAEYRKKNQDWHKRLKEENEAKEKVTPALGNTSAKLPPLVK